MFKKVLKISCGRVFCMDESGIWAEGHWAWSQMWLFQCMPFWGQGDFQGYGREKGEGLTHPCNVVLKIGLMK